MHKPAFAVEGYDVSFNDGGQASSCHLWNTMPVIDVLNLKENEGEDYNGEIDILFASRFSSTYTV